MSKRGPVAFINSGMHNYKYTAYWLNNYLREFVRDTLSSSGAVNSGLFDYLYLTKALEEHYLRCQEHTKEIQLALDLAVAQKIFKAVL
jgi:hypothetical protein